MTTVFLVLIIILQTQGSGWTSMLFMIAIVLVIYFFLIRPKMKTNLQVSEKGVTKSKWSKTTWVVIIIISIVAISRITNNDNSNSKEVDIKEYDPRDYERPQPLPSIDSRNYYTNQECLAATSEENYDELLKVSNARNKEALLQMIMGDRAVILKANTKVFKLSGFMTYRIRVLTGDHQGQELFIATEFLTR